MSKALKDGEVREMRPHPVWGEKAVAVIAYREDCDTPWVILSNGREAAPFEVRLTDSGARDLIERLQRALRLLPTSK